MNMGPGAAGWARIMAWGRVLGAFGAVVITAYHPCGIALQIWTTPQETGGLPHFPSPWSCRWPPPPLPLAAYIEEVPT